MKKVLLIFMICFALVLTPVFFSGCNEPDFKGEIILPAPPQQEDDGTETPNVDKDNPSTPDDETKPEVPKDEMKPETPTDDEKVEPPAQETNPFSAAEKDQLVLIVKSAISQAENLTVERFQSFFIENYLKIVIKFNAPVTLETLAGTINPAIKNSKPQDVNFNSESDEALLYITFSKIK